MNRPRLHAFLADETAEAAVEVLLILTFVVLPLCVLALAALEVERRYLSFISFSLSLPFP